MTSLQQTKVKVRRTGQKLTRKVRVRGGHRMRTVTRAALRRKPPAHMIHVGKTGGTALKDTLTPLRTKGRYELHLHKHRTTLADIPFGEKVFFVIRDPVDRYVSGFNSRLREGRPRYERLWTPQEREAFEQFTTPDELGLALSSEDGATRVQAHIAMMSIQHVQDSYWKWFNQRRYLDRRKGDILLIQWFPDLTATFPRLCEALGLPGNPQLPTDPKRTHKSPSDVSKYMSEQAAENVRWWLARDYAFVELCARMECFAGPTWESTLSSVPELPQTAADA
jgi:hypothetical protein